MNTKQVGIALLSGLISGVVCGAPGDLFVPDGSGGSVIRYNSAGGRDAFATALAVPAAVAFDGKGNVFVGDTPSAGNGTVYKFTAGGVRTVFASGFYAAQGLTFDPAGNLFVSEGLFLFGPTSIYKVDPTGAKTVFANAVGAPVGIVTDAAGNLYAADFVTDSVLKFTPAGVKSTFATGIASPYGIAIDSAGNLFVSSSGAKTIVKVSRTGVKTQFASGLAGPTGLAFDPSGNLYVADNTSPPSIFVFTPSGSKSTFAGAGDPKLIAFQPTLHTLLNISTRAFVQTGDSVLIGGFIVGGNGQVNTSILARALGPSLANQNVPNPLADPLIEIYDSTGAVIAQNDDWKNGAQAAQVQSLGVAPPNDHESALITALPAGNYTAVVRGANNTTGNALVEVYNLQ